VDFHLSLRPERAADEALLLALYATTRQRELAMTGWGPAECDAFVKSQFAAMRQGYAMSFPEAQFLIIVANGQAVGRMIVNRTDFEILLVDIILAPEFRRRKIGSALLKELMAEAAQGGRPVRLHVYRDDMEAAKFYTRLGFTKSAEQGLHDLWEWRSPVN